MYGTNVQFLVARFIFRYVGRYLQFNTVSLIYFLNTQVYVLGSA